MQLILAGKAHPKDDDGKRLVQRLFEMKAHLEVGRRVVYLDDYDLALGAAMVRGCDIWVNVPRPPLEASGHQRHQVGDERRPAAVACSTAGGRRPTTAPTAGRSPARSTTTTARRTGATPPSSTGCCTEEVVPTFYERDSDGLLGRPGSRMVRASLRTIGPSFGAGRMVRDYAEKIYPAHVVAPT